nr:MAG TPA: hypothetical protein [Caudoviricetes sp.]
MGWMPGATRGIDARTGWVLASLALQKKLAK